MARIPTYQSGVGLDTDRGGVPNVRLDNSVAAALSDVGASIGNVAAIQAQRADELKRFKAGQALLQWDQGNQAAYDEAIQNLQPAAEGFYNGVTTTLKARRDEFIATLPPDLQEEYGLRADTALTEWDTTAAQRQVTERNTWFRSELSKTLDDLAKGIDMHGPGSLDDYRAQGAEMIGNSSLPPAEKASILEKWQEGAAVAAWKAQLRDDPQGALAALGYGSPIDEATGQPRPGRAADIIRREEGFRTGAYWDVNAWRIGYGSDTVTRADGTVERVTKDTVITREDAERDLQRRLGEFASASARAIGATAWAALPDNVHSALTSVAYNYGSLPKSVITAAKAVRGQPADLEKLAVAVEKLSDNPTRRRREAAIIRGGQIVAATGEIDPAYDAISFDTRAALISDGNSYIRQRATADAASAKAEYDSLMNQLQLDIIDNKAGYADVQEARQTWLTDADDVNKLHTAIEKRDDDAVAAGVALSNLADPAFIFNPYDSDHVDQIDLAYDALGGAEGLTAGDDAAKARLWGVVGRADMVPEAAVEALKAGIYSRTPATRDAAFAIMDELYTEAPRATSRAFTDADLKRLQDYQQLAPLLPPEELAARLNANADPGTAKATEELRQQGLALAREIPTETIISEAFSEGLWMFGSTPDAPLDPISAQQFRADADALIAERYAVSGNIDVAKKQAYERLRNRWGTTRAGNTGRLMANPPEAHYGVVNGSHDWLRDDLRKLVERVAPDAKEWGLVSTAETEGEVAAGQLPAYQVRVVDGDGVTHVLTREDVSNDRHMPDSGEPVLLHFDYLSAREGAIATFEERRPQALENQRLQEMTPRERMRDAREQQLQEDAPLAQPPAPPAGGLSSQYIDAYVTRYREVLIENGTSEANADVLVDRKRAELEARR